jgi:hypothetical protein
VRQYWQYDRLVDKTFALGSGDITFSKYLENQEWEARVAEKIQKRVYFWNSEFRNSNLSQVDLELHFGRFAQIEEAFVKNIKK